jgi:hypothetical protein
MNSNEALMIVLAATLIACAIVIGFATIDQQPPAEIHPVGPMTGGDDNADPYDPMTSAAAPPMEDMIYVPAYPDKTCPPEDRILLDNPIRITTENATYWHWLYECRDEARNRSG